MTPSQIAAVAKLKAYALDYIPVRAEVGNAVVNELVHPFDSGVIMLSFETVYTNLPEGNLLRALDHHYWRAFIGKRGCVTLRSGPDNLKQFHGKKFLGVKIDYA
jgi:hypothetical protein